MAFRTKKRSPYDKIVKNVLEQFRQEMAPVRDVALSQERIFAQNEKIIEFLRQIWERLEDRQSTARTQGPG
ncbi:MAG: hypothetical protein P4N59_33260 [Negativicutes bacterium]|nr:hypothetical protein [Negativicutes bacterium]